MPGHYTHQHILRGPFWAQPMALVAGYCVFVSVVLWATGPMTSQ